MVHNPKTVTIIFAVLDLILMVVFGILYLRKDRVPPVIQFQPADITYMETTTDDELLAGAHALDTKDGDVSDRVVIEKIVLNHTTGNAVVYYAASDYDGNVGKSSRTFPASPALFEGATTEQTGYVMETEEGSQGAPVSMEGGNTSTRTQGPLMQSAGGGQEREIVGALDNNP